MKRTLRFLLVLTIGMHFSACSAMNWLRKSQQGGFDENKVQEYLNKQQYAEAMELFEKSIYQDKNSKAVDLLNRAAEQWHVPCIYHSFRKFVHNSLNGAPTTPDLMEMLSMMLVSLVLTKADVDCCLLQSQPFKSKKESPYNLLLRNYAKRLGEANLQEIPEIEAIVTMAKTKFYYIDINTLPYPVWVCETWNNSWMSEWVHFGTPSDTLRGLYKNRDLINFVEKMRRTSHGITWARLEKMVTWTDLFDTKCENFETVELRENDELSQSILNIQNNQSLQEQIYTVNQQQEQIYTENQSEDEKKTLNLSEQK